jgi:hypothetical protein
MVTCGTLRSMIGGQLSRMSQELIRATNYFAPLGGGSRSPDCALLRNPGNGGPAWSFALHPGYKLHLTWRPEVDCDGMR